MTPIGEILFDLFIIFLAAKVAGEIFSRLGLPTVIGELLIGTVIGPHALGLIGQPGSGLIGLFDGNLEAAHAAQELVYEVLAEIGVIVLLFFVGLETRVEDLVSVGGRASLVAILGIILPFLTGAGFLLAQGEPAIEAVFLGAAMVATSVGITARVLADLDALHTYPARIILGAAVIDDLLGLLILATVVGLGRAGGISAVEIGLLALQAIGFTVFVILVGTRMIRRYSIHFERLQISNPPLIVGLIICLGLAAVASRIGLAGIIGAFLAGMVVAESRERRAIEHQIQPIYDFLVPFFFVITGARVDPGVFLNQTLLGVALVITALAILGKLIGCGLGAWGLGLRTMALVGVGMVPRGEVGLIVASAGRSLAVIPEELFSVIVMMSVLTTLIVPPVLSVLIKSPSPSDRMVKT